jgi:1,4-alpha-glucan branching enzyme
MGQEFLADEQWDPNPAKVDNLIKFGALESGDKALTDHLRFTQDLTRLRWNQPALRGDNLHAFHVHNRNRVIAFHRWMEGSGQDVVVVATLAEATWFSYEIGFPFAGHWSTRLLRVMAEGFRRQEVHCTAFLPPPVW